MSRSGLAKAITPTVFRMVGEVADAMARNGLVMLGPWDGWGESRERRLRS